MQLLFQLVFQKNYVMYNIANIKQLRYITILSSKEKIHLLERQVDLEFKFDGFNLMSSFFMIHIHFWDYREYVVVS